MTYYGRWTYKYEEASAKGAAACIIVHETGPAGYPWAVVASSWGRENFSLQTPDGGAGLTLVDGWITLAFAKSLFAAAGQDFDTLKAAAVSRDFHPVVLKAKVSMVGGEHDSAARLAQRGGQARGVGSGPARRMCRRLGPLGPPGPKSAACPAGRSTAGRSTTPPAARGSEIARKFAELPKAERPKRTSCSWPSRPRSRASSAPDTTCSIPSTPWPRLWP